MTIRLAGNPNQQPISPQERPAPSTTPDNRPGQGNPEAPPGNPRENDFPNPASQPEVTPNKNGADWRVGSNR